MGARILVIEDGPEDGAFARAVLEAAGYTVQLVPDAEQGLLEARRGGPELIVMDVQLPGLDGWEATRRLKSDPLTAHVPVLVLTVTRLARTRVTESRCDGALQKPVKPDELLTQIASLLSR